MKAKPIFEFTLLTQEQKDQVHNWRFDDGLSILDTRAAIKEKFGVEISKNKVDAQCKRWQFADAFGISETDLLALLNGEPVQIDADGLQAIRQKALLMTVREDLTPAQLKMLQNIFDYDFRKEVIQTRLQLAKNRDARAQTMLEIAKERLELSKRASINRSSPALRDEEAHSSINCSSRREEAHSSINCSSRREEAHSIPPHAHDAPAPYVPVPSPAWLPKLTRPPLNLETAGCGEIFADLQANPPTSLHDPRVIAWQNKAWAIDGLTPDQIQQRRARLIADAEKENAATHNEATPHENHTAPTTGPTPSRQVLECGGTPPLSSAPAATHNPPLHACPSTPSTPQENPAALAHCPSSIAHENSPSVPAVSSENSASNEPTPTAPTPAVAAYTRARTQEFSTKTCTPSAFVTALKHCPCGHDLPCPDHAPASNPFPKLFWHISPEDPDYTRELIKRGLYPDPARNSAAQAQAAKLKARVQEYTDFRNHEYEYLGWNDYYVTTLQYCPCGHGLPCPDHAPENNAFPDAFWSASVYDPEYGEALVSHGLPYTRPSDTDQSRAAA